MFSDPRTFLSSIVAAISLLIVSSLPVCLQAMPPAPGVREQMTQAGTWQHYLDVYREARRRGVDQPFPNPLEEMRRLHRDDGDEITLRFPVILCDFDDKPADANDHNRAYYERQIFGRTGTSMRDFYAANSYGEVNLEGDVVGWIRMEQSYEYYSRNNFGQEGGGEELATDACMAARDLLDFRRYDNNGDNHVEAVLIIHAGIGAEETGDESDIWSHAGRLTLPERVDGMGYLMFCVNPEISSGGMGVYAHEMGHALLGLPDLYDTDGSSEGIGNWSLMAGGSWIGPSLMDAWCRVHLGWVRPVIFEQNWLNVHIPPATEDDDVIRYDIDSPNEYFLFENRRQTGWDERLPGAGLLIYHVDERMGNPWGGNNNEWYPGLDSTEHYRVAVEQADGRWNLDRGDNRGDGGDPFPGSSGNRRFADDTSPSSRGYLHQRSRINVMNIRQENADIICDFVTGLEGYNFNFISFGVSPERITAGRSVTITYRLTNSGNMISDATAVRFFLSTDDRFSQNDAQLGADQVENRLGHGISSNREIERTVPNDIQPGAYYLLAVADPDNNLREMDESDNVASRRLLVGGEPNLNARSVAASPAYIDPGETVTVEYDILNDGGERADDISVEFFLSRDTLRTNDDLSLGAAIEAGPIEAGALFNASVERVLPNTVSPGRNYVLMNIDRQNHIRELDESDNTAFASFTVPGPDLRVVYGTVEPELLEPGDEIEISAWFANSGLVTAPTSGIGYALSRDEFLSNDDRTLMPIPTLDSLAVADTIISTQSRTIPNDVWWGGDIFLLVKSDCFGRIPELFEDNNVLAIPVRLVGFGVTEEESQPSGFGLVRAYPNPFNSTLNISFSLPSPGAVRITSLDISGRNATTIFDSFESPGRHEIEWSPHSLRSGIYFLRIDAGGEVSHLKVCHLK